MDEYVDEEQGGYKLAFAFRAEECEKHGDFLFAADLRSAAGEYCTLVVLPYHEKRAAALEKQGQATQAKFHRAVAKDCRRQSEAHQRMARGDRLLAAVPGLQGPAGKPQLRQHYFNAYQLYHQRVLSAKGAQWLTGRTPQQVAAALTEKGLVHADEDARYASVVVLAQMDKRDALLNALGDKSPLVRHEAAAALARTPWADGWMACLRHDDPKVKDAVKRLLEPLAEVPFDRTIEIIELLRGLDSPSEPTRSFCSQALQQISGKTDMNAGTWRAWWKEMGDLRPGLVRTGPKGREAVDSTVDAGAWWQTGDRSVRGATNPLAAHPLPARFEWRGKLVVTQPGGYRFFVRNRGEKLQGFDQHQYLYFTSPRAKLTIDGKLIVPNPEVTSIEDAKMHVRIDLSEPIPLKAGLHDIRVELDARSAGTSSWEDPSVRLYWESENFLRQLVPADRLVHEPTP